MDNEALIKRLLLLPKEDRKRLAIKLFDSVTNDEMDHQDRYDMLVMKAEAVTGHVLTASKNRDNTTIRKFVAARLFKDGIGCMEVGRLMGRDHATVIHLRKEMQNMIDCPRVFRKEIEMYELFNKLVDEFDNG